MRAVEIVEYAGPTALRVGEVPAPQPGADDVVISVRAAGVAFPEVLQSWGKYQLQPTLPFVPGSEVAGLVHSAPEGSGFAPGDRVFAWTLLGGFAETAVASTHRTFRLPDAIDFAEGASLFLNAQTAYFSLVTRGRAVAGESVLITGGAGGVGTAAIQVGNALGLRTIALVSTPEKGQVAREAGAAEVVLGGDGWKDRVLELAPGGVELVLDVVGDDVVDCLRVLRDGGRLLIVGFAGGEIPEVKVNRLLLRNLEVIGVSFGSTAIANPGLTREIGDALDAMLQAGHIRPIVGARLPLEQAADALTLLAERRAVGKVVLETGA